MVQNFQAHKLFLPKVFMVLMLNKNTTSSRNTYLNNNLSIDVFTNPNWWKLRQIVKVRIIIWLMNMMKMEGKPFLIAKIVNLTTANEVISARDPKILRDHLSPRAEMIFNIIILTFDIILSIIVFNNLSIYLKLLD